MTCILNLIVFKLCLYLIKEFEKCSGGQNLKNSQKDLKFED